MAAAKRSNAVIAKMSGRSRRMKRFLTLQQRKSWMTKASRGEIYRERLDKAVKKSVFCGKISGMTVTPCVIWLLVNIIRYFAVLFKCDSSMVM